MNKEFIDSKLNSLSISSKVRKSDFTGEFYDHLYSMSGFDLVSNGSNVKGRFTFNQYLGLEQYIFEHSTVLEKNPPAQVNWDLLDLARTKLKVRLRELLGKEAQSETLKPIIRFTIDAFENFLLYSMMHQKSMINPWIPTENVFRKGYLFLASDNRDLLDEFNPKIYSETKDQYKGNLGFLATSNQEKGFKGFVVDDRLSVQANVFEFLKTHASGFDNAKSAKDILAWLDESDMKIRKSKLVSSILFPLKRIGQIGSSSTGYFFIKTMSDLRKCYDFHHAKLRGLKRTLQIYESRANRMNGNLHADDNPDVITF